MQKNIDKERENFYNVDILKMYYSTEERNNE